MEQGQQALLAGEYTTARDAFSDLLTVDPRNRDGAGRSDLRLRSPRGLPPRSHRPGKGTGNQLGSVTSFRHQWCCDLPPCKKPLRAIKLLVDYMTRLSGLDEVSVDAVAVTLNQTDDQSRRSRLYTDGLKFYTSQNAKLEKLRSGMKRWGTVWLPEDEADTKATAWNRHCRGHWRTARAGDAQVPSGRGRARSGRSCI